MKFWLPFLLCYASVVTVLIADPFHHFPRGVDAKGRDANFNLLGGIVLDSHGNIFVSDTWDQTIRKITPDGTVTTIAGKAGAEGSADGDGSDARFSSPKGLAVDPNDNIYVADSRNNCIRKITPRGVVTTFAGISKPRYRSAWEGPSGISGGPRIAVTEDGGIKTATFADPTELAFDHAGNLYVADGKIRRISAAGIVSTIGTGNVRHATGIAADGEGNLYVSDDDTDNGTIFKLTPNGASTVVAKYAGHGSETLFRPSHVGIAPNGDIYSFGHGSLLKVSANGIATILAGSFKYGHPHIKEGLGKEATLFEDAKLAFDHDGNIYLANQFMVVKVSSAGVLTFFAGSPSRVSSGDGKGREARFDQPEGIAVDKSGMIYIADSGNEIIRKVTPDGVVTTFAGTPDEEGFVDGPGNKAKFMRPLGLAFDGEGNLLVADSRNDAIRKITPDGVVSTLVQDVVGHGAYVFEHGGSAFYGPRRLVIGPDRQLYVTASNAVLRFDSAGQRTVFAGSLDEDAGGTTDGVGPEARLGEPGALVFDRTGNLYVADGAIRKITTDGKVITYYKAGNGKSDRATIQRPRGLAIGPDGVLYVADSNNNVIRKLSFKGVVSTLAGVPSQSSGGRDGPGTSAEFCYPMDLAFDEHGNLYVTDYFGEAVRKITPDGTVITLAGGNRAD
jgi:sugar lactone lactonase YvrE